MNFVLDILLIGVPTLLFVLGWWRGIQREALTLCGILLGALLAEWWAPVWAENNTILNRDPATLKAWISSGLLLFTSTFLGYGGALLLPSRRRLAQGITRIYGALVGGLNGLLMTGLLMRYSIEQRAGEDVPVEATRFSLVLAERLPFFLLWGVIGATIVVLFSLVTRVLVRIHKGPSVEPQASKEKSAPIQPRPEPFMPKPPRPDTVQDPILRDLLADEYGKKH